MSSERAPGLDGGGKALYERIGRSVVDLEVAGKGGEPFGTLGVVLGERSVAAWLGLVSGAAGVAALLAVTVRQGSRSWMGQVGGFRMLWATCLVQVADGLLLPPVPVRRSTSLEPGERVLAVGMDGSGRRVAWGHLLESQRCIADQPYDSSVVWVMGIEEPGCSHHALAFDEAGRVAGLVESLPGAPSIGVLLPGERLAGHLGRSFTEMLLSIGEHAQVAQSSLLRPEAFLDAESLCALGLSCRALGDAEGALRAWRRAAVEDPRNPWPHQASGEILASLGRFDEADAAFRQASRLEVGA